MPRSDSELQITAPFNYAETKKPDGQVRTITCLQAEARTNNLGRRCPFQAGRAGFGDPTVMPAGRPGVTIQPETPHGIQPVDCGGDLSVCQTNYSDGSKKRYSRQS